MIRTAIWFIYFWLYLLMVLPAFFYARKLDKQGKSTELSTLAHQEAVKWARSLIKLAGGKIHVSGQEKIPAEGSVLFVSNHQGNFDIPIFIGFVNKPKGFIAKVEILKLPMIRDWMKFLKCVFMDRNDIRQSLQTINQAAEYLKEGHSMVIFPEGTRSKCNNMNDFKPGSFKLAVKAGVPVVPVTIKGSYKMMEQNGFIIKPAEVEVIIHDAIPTAGLSKEEASILPDKVYQIIKEKL